MEAQHLLNDQECYEHDERSVQPFALPLHEGIERTRLPQALTDMPKAALGLATLVSTFMAVAIISSLLRHTPGSYIKVLTISQVHVPRPFLDTADWPLEAAGSNRCGTFPAEAKSRNCTFDLMHYSYTAPDCYYPDLAMQALASGPWSWYLDADEKLEIPQELDMLSRVAEVFVQWDYFRVRCLYLRSMVERAKQNDSFLVPQELIWNSSQNDCQAVWDNDAGWESNNRSLIVARLTYNPCVRLSDAERMFHDVERQADTLF